MNILLSTFGKFSFTGYNLYTTLGVCALNATLMCFLSAKLLQMLQLSSYKNRGYFGWLKNNKKKYISRIGLLCFLSLISVSVGTALLYGYGVYFTYISLLFYVYFCLVFTCNLARLPQKVPLKQTHRMNRLIATLAILVAGLTYVMIILTENYLPYFRHAIIVISPLLMLLLVPFANILNKPLEMLIGYGYIRRAKAKLDKMPNLIKIGITGSYGKTSTKHYLNVMLAKKYSVCMTPHSFNTPMGLTKVILNYLKKENQVLICEMGAKSRGDIKYLCDLVQPKHGIITSVGSQHLHTFGSEENIAKTKYELAESITDGFVIFNAQSKGSKNLYKQCNKNKYLTGIEYSKAYCNITNVKVSSSGSDFTLNIDGNSIDCTTKLLGEYNLEDIAMASALAYKLDVSLTDIRDAIKSLTPMAHRMEIIESNGLTILDNSYNCSVESSRASLKTLKLFSGNKIIVTPGIVEMGEKEDQANYDFGYDIAKVCNKVIIVNEVNKEAITEGLKDQGFDTNDILFAESLKKAQELLPQITKPGDIVLFENDLPDNYT